MSRKPTETSIARIQPLARLPVFFALEGRRVVIAGGSEAAAWKAELLAAAGAQVELYAEHPSHELLSVIASLANDRIDLRKRPWSVEVIKGAALAILATENDAKHKPSAVRRKPTACHAMLLIARPSVTFLLVALSTDHL